MSSYAKNIGLTAAAIGAGGILAWFGNKGIRGGSMASSIQSRTGNVSSGSLFSKMTSDGMTGAFSALAIGGGLLAGVGYYLEEQERIRKERERDKIKINTEEYLKTNNRLIEEKTKRNQNNLKRNQWL